MGERTQLLINVKDKEDNLIIGTVLHYQWGYGRVMPMDALSLVSQFPPKYKLENEEYNYYSAIDNFLKNELGLKDPIYARKLYVWLDSHSDDGSNIILNFDKTEQNLEKNIYNSYGNNKRDLQLAFCATEDNFYKQCDNNDGFMIANITLSKNSAVSSCEFKFCYYPGELIPFEEYGAYPIHNDWLTPKFIEAYKTLCEYYNIQVN